MEFVEGKTLEALIPRNGFSIGELLRYSTQAADAIANAHSASILHRDIKPGNVIVTNDGQVKVLDFGLAKVIHAPAAIDQGTTGPLLAITERGLVVGTPSYMSPEQAAGKLSIAVPMCFRSEP
jgi:serine/threonine protein kinase